MRWEVEDISFTPRTSECVVPGSGSDWRDRPARQSCSYPRIVSAILHSVQSRTEYKYKYRHYFRLYQNINRNSFPVLRQAQEPVLAQEPALTHQSDGLIPPEGAVEGVEGGASGVGEVDGEAAAAVEAEVEEGGSFVVAGDGVGEGAIELVEFGRGGAELGGEVAEVVVEDEGGGGIEVALDGGG